MSAVAEKPRSLNPRFAAVESPSPAVGRTEALAIPAELLDGGEVVLLALKPSLWFVCFDAARWIVFGGVLMVVAGTNSIALPGVSSPALVQLGFLMLVTRLAIALLRWVSRFYVLTNRRIMRLRGVFKADILSCPLLKIRSTRVNVDLHERATNLGTILFVSDDMPEADLHWYYLARVEEVHARVRRAIERAQDNQPRT